MSDRTHDQQYEKYDEENFCDLCCRTGDTPESEDPGDDGEDEERDCPTQHLSVPPFSCSVVPDELTRSSQKAQAFDEFD
jgi:hypothetical protein